MSEPSRTIKDLPIFFRGAKSAAREVSAAGLYREGLKALTSTGNSNAAQEALWLVEAATGFTRLAMFTDPEQPVSSVGLARAKSYFRRRVDGEPLQYILGHQEFYGLELEVEPGVFIPRPETALLVEEAVNHLSGGLPSTVADLCTGSGCVAVALTTQCPNLTVYATDLNVVSLEVAKRNAARHGVDQRNTFLLGNLFDPLEDKHLKGTLSGLVSNPPYICSGEIDRLPRDVREYEPRAALDGGPDGMDFYRRILFRAWEFLRIGGFLLLEAGQGQAPFIVQEAEKVGHYAVRGIRLDSGDIERVVSVERTN